MKRPVKAGQITIGGNSPISIQSMTNTPTEDVVATLAQVRRLHTAGAELVRVSVPSESAAKAFAAICAAAPVPIIADIHFDYKLALAAIAGGAAKIRINPANIGDYGVGEIVKAAKDKGIAIRVGVNSGSLKEEHTPKELAQLALVTAQKLEDRGFFDTVIAVKSSDVRKTVEAYRELHAICDYPLHIGLTESGTPRYGQIKSAVAIGSLLLDGIGDTIRISLSAPPEEEVSAAIRILRACGLRNDFVEVIACPTCARTNIDIEKIASAIEDATQNIPKRLKIAVMGCVVNGIGESMGADFGVCGGKEQSSIIKNKKIIATVSNTEIIPTLLTLVKEYNG